MSGFQTSWRPTPVYQRGRPAMPVVPFERCHPEIAEQRRRAEEAEQAAREAAELAARIEAANEQLRAAESRLEAAQMEAARIGAGKGSMRAIIRVVSSATGVSPIDLVSLRRDARTAKARQIVAWLARKLTVLSLPQIGARLGRDHTTILHAINRCDEAAQLLPDRSRTPSDWAADLWAIKWP